MLPWPFLGKETGNFSFLIDAFGNRSLELLYIFLIFDILSSATVNTN